MGVPGQKPAPDPGNAQPEEWTEDLDPAEQSELTAELAAELESS